VWRKGEPANDVVIGLLWMSRILLFVFLPIIVLALIGALVSDRWLAIPVVLAWVALLYGLRRFALWVSANSTR
jgi:hypothetical protein